MFESLFVFIWGIQGFSFGVEEGEEPNVEWPNSKRGDGGSKNPQTGLDSDHRQGQPHLRQCNPRANHPKFTYWMLSDVELFIIV